MGIYDGGLGDMTDAELIQRIKAALSTQEDGEALIEVARNAHKCEMELASYYNFGEDDGV